jgi:high-affinity Fe2+/Pb2+ permease
MPLYPGSTTYLGLGLWNSVAGTMIVELGMFAVGIWLYATTTRAINRTGAVTFWALVVFLFVMYFATAFGPPPPSADMIKMMGPVTWIFIPWGWWIDRNRSVVARDVAPSGA